MSTTQTGTTAGLGTMALVCFGALAHCSSGSSGAAPPGEVATTSVRDGGAGLTGDGSQLGDGAAVTAPPRVACESAASCTGGATAACCDGYCTDTSKDPNNCGQCGAACTTSQFCTGAACDDAILANVCDNHRATVAFDPYQEDNGAGSAMGGALSADCTPAVSLLQTSQHSSGILDPSSGRPITGVGDTFITGGGSYGQNGVAYMESALTPVYLWTDGTTAQIKTRAGNAVVNTAVSALTAHHDFFYVQVSVEPQSGTLCFDGAGILAPGTVAAGYYAQSELIPNRAKYTSSSYVYEWVDTNNDSTPNAGDTFTQMSGGE
jgi:stigma-specific protein Stig1